MENRIHTENLHDHIGEEVTLAGWVHNTRDHGKVTFVDLRDKTSIVQLVSKEVGDAHETVDNLRREWVIKITGEVNERPDNMVNEDEELGDLEVKITDISVLNEANTPPFELDDGTSDVDENRRMEHRYLDLRSLRMQDNIRTRHEVVKFFRDYLDDRGFIEVETPILGKSTPEGARDYLVPSRKHTGQFYALPQSPQQYKQLLMNSGIDRYFQIARAFRDEDTRKDRQPEHTQLDIEMSFTDPEEVMSLIEDMVNAMMEQVFPDKKVKKPWPRISYEEAMDEYGNDKPDLRDNPDDPDEIAFGWVVDFPQFEEDEDTGLPTPVHHMFVQPEEGSIDMLDDKPLEMVSTQYDWICNGFELASGSIRISDTDLQRKVMKTIGLEDEEIEKKFGHILQAFEYGVPPHGGIAPGIDRLIMILQDEPSIREVMAFPKTGDGRDLLMDAPSDVSDQQLHELGLEVIEGEEEDES